MNITIDELKKTKNELNKSQVIIKSLIRWIEVEQRNINFADWIRNFGYTKIAVYGLGDLGRLLVKELYINGLDVYYGIDRNRPSCQYLDRVYAVDDDLPKVDLIIVTVIYDFASISKMLSDKIDCPIISLEDLLFRM